MTMLFRETAGWAAVRVVVPLPYLESDENWLGVAVAEVSALLMLMLPAPTKFSTRAVDVGL